MAEQNNRSKDFRNSMAKYNTPHMLIINEKFFERAEAKSYVKKIYEPYIRYDENDKELNRADEQSR